MKKLMFIAAVLAAGISSADVNPPTNEPSGYSPSAVPSGITSPAVMPGMINFQGLLRDPATGNLYADGVYTLECRLFTAISGTKAIWGARYDAYVREGYFNIMLGEVGTKLSGDITYKEPTDLWKALWYNGSNQSLFLGVTPWQGPDGQFLADDDRVEISPRQQLLAAPFALRAHKAQYADTAVKDFSVPGDLRVFGQIKTSDGKVFGIPNVASSDESLDLGSTDSPPQTNLKGKEVVIESGEALNINPGTDATFTLKAGKSLTVTDGSVGVSNAPEFSVNADRINLMSGPVGSSQFGINIAKSSVPKEGNKVSVDGDMIELIEKSNVGDKLQSRVSLSSKTVNIDGNVKCKGSYSGTARSPVVFRSVVIKLDANQTQTSGSLKSLIGDWVLDYKWSIAGYTFLEEGLNETQWRSPELRRLRCNGWVVEIGLDGHSSKSRKFRIQVMGVASQWCDDNRADPDDEYTNYED